MPPSQPSGTGGSRPSERVGDQPGERFEDVDLSAVDRSRTVSRRNVGFLLSVAGLVVAFAYDYYALDTRALVGTWDPIQVDWLFLLAVLVLVFYAAVPLATDRERTRRYWRRLRANPVGLLAFVYIVLFFVGGTLGETLVQENIANLYRRYQPPVFWYSDTSITDPCLGRVVGDTCYGSWEYPLGSNAIGKSVTWMLLAGMHVSLLVALVAGAIIAPLGAAVGLVAGYYGGWVDQLLMRYVDVQQTIPAFVVYLALMTAYKPSMTLLLLVFGLFSWGTVARLVRSEVVQRRQESYVTAARAAGASRLTVVRDHILPNVTATVVTATTQLVPILILTEAGLGFLRMNESAGLSWGEAIANGLSGKYATFPRTMGPTFGSSVAWQHKWWTLAFPLLALLLTVVAFAAFGDALRDVLDPRDEV